MNKEDHEYWKRIQEDTEGMTAFEFLSYLDPNSEYYQVPKKDLPKTDE